MGKHRRENAGKSDNSYKKHTAIIKAAGALIGKKRYHFPLAKIVIVDANSGDGYGVARPDLDLFETYKSESTAELSIRLAHKNDCDVILCENVKDRRETLTDRFGRDPYVTILASNEDAPDLIKARGYDYALVISDPCGSKAINVETCLQRIEANVRKADFIIVMNFQWLKRLWSVPEGTKWSPHRRLYLPMNKVGYWLTRLRRRSLAISARLTWQSQNFMWGLLVISDYLPDYFKTKDFKRFTNDDHDACLANLESASAKPAPNAKSGGDQPDNRPTQGSWLF